MENGNTARWELNNVRKENVIWEEPLQREILQEILRGPVWIEVMLDKIHDKMESQGVLIESDVDLTQKGTLELEDDSKIIYHKKYDSESAVIYINQYSYIVIYRNDVSGKYGIDYYDNR